MIKCDYCGRNLAYEKSSVIKWFGGVGNSGELHFHKGCFCLVLKQLNQALTEKSGAISFDEIKYEQLDCGTVNLRGA